jgi:hypothetical protein
MSDRIFSKGKMGIDANRPIDAGSGAIAPQYADPTIIADTGAAFVRLNFVLGPWRSPADTTLHAGRTWFQTYDTIVDGLLAKGLGVYALVGAEATSRPDPGNRFRQATPNPDAEDWLREYVANFAAIVAHFAGRIHIYESFNEPNDWHGGQSSWVHPYWFARMLRDLYQKIKIDDRRDVILVSGPLLTHDLPGGGDDGTAYLDQTYRLGRQSHGWEAFQAANGTYPLDDIGYHLYVGLSPTAAPADIEAVITRYLNAIWSVITRYEGNLTEKGLHVSEYGWTSDNGEAKQASNLQTAFRLLRDHPRVKTAAWFCLQDFPGQNYGLYRAGAFTASNRKQAYAAFKALCAESVPAPLVGYDSAGRSYPAIIAAYERNGGEKVLGVPTDNGGGVYVHRWGAGVVQDFINSKGQKAIIMLKDGASQAYVVRGVIHNRYIYTYGGALGPLGYPVEDQNEDEWGLPRCRFEHGIIGCRTYTEIYEE